MFILIMVDVMKTNQVLMCTKNTLNLAIGMLFFVIVVSCGESFEKLYESQTTDKSGQELYQALLRLDQTYPNKIKLKINIGTMLLVSGDLAGAKAYLDRGEKLVGVFTDKETKYALFSSKAELALREGDPSEALKYAEKAISASKTDRKGVVFTRAKAHVGLGNTKDALNDFDKGWSEHKDTMTAEDFRAYAIQLVKGGRDSDAIEILRVFQGKYPYEAGVGLIESGCYERSGDLKSAILSAFKEYEYARAFGGLSDKDLTSSLDIALAKSERISRKALERFVAAIKSFVNEEWTGVGDIDASGFGEYIVLAARLENGNASTMDIERYLLMESSMRSFQAYYYHLWRGLRKIARANGTSGIRSVLEKCISLSGSSHMAKESRRELGRLIGIGESAGENLLMQQEIDAILASVIGGGSFSLLDPVLALLDTPDNDYQQSGMYSLIRLASDPALKSWLDGKAKNAKGKLGERLNYILSY